MMEILFWEQEKKTKKNQNNKAAENAQGNNQQTCLKAALWSF